MLSGPEEAFLRFLSMVIMSSSADIGRLYGYVSCEGESKGVLVVSRIFRSIFDTMEIR